MSIYSFRKGSICAHWSEHVCIAKKNNQYKTNKQKSDGGKLGYFESNQYNKAVTLVEIGILFISGMLLKILLFPGYQNTLCFKLPKSELVS